MRIQFLGIDKTSLLNTIRQDVAMNNRKHIYFITISDLQQLAKEKIGRSLSETEVARITDKLLDGIRWYDVVEDAILYETEPSPP